MSVTVKWDHRKLMADIVSEMKEESLAVAKQVATQAKAFCPRETGALADSIEAKKSKYDKGAVVMVGGGEQYYASFVELGRKRAPAYPFLRPAVEVIRPIVRARFERRLKKAIG